MDLDPLLLEVLACPCPRHEPVEPDPVASAIVCTYCRSRFPVLDDIPVMLLDEATPGPNGVGEPAAAPDPG
jgi:uncharacterized protein YbaR (Trm112 family)